jgi:hypothetical protein
VPTAPAFDPLVVLLSLVASALSLAGTVAVLVVGILHWAEVVAVLVHLVHPVG